MRTTLRDLTTIEELLNNDSDVSIEVRKDIKSYRIYFYRNYINESSDVESLNIQTLMIDTDLIRLNINDVLYDNLNALNDYLSGIDINNITNINPGVDAQIKDFIHLFIINDQADGFEIILPYNEESYAINDIKLIYKHVVEMLKIQNPLYQV